MTPAAEENVLRKYRLIAEIGRGGMADVYLAVVQGPAGFNKLVVIKKARTELAQDPEFLAMFLDEARLAARLNHPNVVQTHEVGNEGDRYFIAMEYLDGQPLNRIRARAGQGFTTAMQIRVLADVLAGLHHAHDLADFDGTPLGVVHRDATPQNVFVTYDGLVKVVDFGIAKAIDSSSETRSGVVKGKVPYMAPEQARGHRVDRRTDVFAVGVMLWEAVVGRRMWKGVPDIKVVHDVIHGLMPDLREAVPEVPDNLYAIVKRALAVSPDDRYAAAADMQHDLEEYLATLDERPTARDVGKFVGTRFAEDRAKVKTLIEGQLKDIRWSGSYPRATGSELPKIDPGQVMITPTGARLAGSETSAPSLTQASVTRDASQKQELPAPKPNRNIALIAVAVGAAAIVVFLGLRFVVPKGAPAAPTPAPEAAATPAVVRDAPSTMAPKPGEDAVKLSVRVTPHDAKIYLDGVLLSAGPFEGKLVKSTATRTLRAEAPKYLPKEETVTLGGDVILSFSLEKDGSKDAPPPPVAGVGGPRPRPGNAAVDAAAPTPPPPAATPTQPPADTLHQPGQKPKRVIDSDSPYSQ